MGTKPEDVTTRRIYFAKDIMQLLGVKKTKAYEIIRRLNKKLDELGFITVEGRVSAAFADEQLGLNYEGRQKYEGLNC